MLEAHYFEYEDSLEDYKKWLGCLLSTFFLIFLIFWKEMFKERAADKLKEIEIRIDAYSKRITLFREKYRLRS